MTTLLKTRIEILGHQIEIFKMRAHWWMASAITGECKSRVLSHGTLGPEFTDDEKVKDAMDTAARQIDLMKEAIETKEGLLYDSLKKGEANHEE